MLLLKNSFRALKDNKGKIAGFVVLVFLICFVSSLFNNAFSFLKQSNENYYTEQNVYDFRTLPKVEPTEIAIGNIEKIYEEKMKKLAEKHDFYYEVQKTALFEFEDNDNEYSYLLIIPQKKINKPYVTEGRLPQKDHEVTVTDQYARNNNLKIGDSIDIDDTQYTITGFAYQSDFIYPVLDEEIPEVEPWAQSIVFVTENTINEFEEDIRYAYSARFNDNTYDYDKVMELRAAAKDDTEYLNSRNNKINRTRTFFLYQQIHDLSVFLNCFLVFLFLIITFSLILILRKRIEGDKSKLGQLKALGYNNFEIAISYVSLAVLASVVGGTLGFTGGYFGALRAVDILTTHMLQLPISFTGFSLLGLAASIFIPFAVLAIISFITAMLVINKQPLNLMYENRIKKLRSLSRRVARLCKTRSFAVQFKLGELVKSPLRFIGVFLIMLIISVLLIVGLIATNMVKFNTEAKIKQVAYAYEVAFEDDVKVSDIQTDVYCEPSTDMRLFLKESIKANGERVKYEFLHNNDYALEPFYIDMMAFATGSFLRPIYDIKTGEVINDKLRGNEIGISAIVSQLLDVQIGDSIVFLSTDDPLVPKEEVVEKTYKVVAISENYDEVDAYAALDTIQKDFGRPGEISTIYTDGKYVNEDQEYIAVAGKEEIQSFKQEAVIPNLLVFTFSGILLLISFLVLLILANIIIDENRKSISFLSIIGYGKKEISRMVVDNYTPIIVIAYLVALPISLYVCRQFTYIMAVKNYTTYSVAISPLLYIIGGIGLFLAYKLAIRVVRGTIKTKEWKTDTY